MKWTFEEKILTRHIIQCDFCGKDENVSAERKIKMLVDMLPTIGWTINEKTGAVKCGNCNWNDEKNKILP